MKTVRKLVFVFQLNAMSAPTRGARKDLWRLEIYVDILYTPRADFFRGSASLGFRLLDFDALVIGDEGAFTEDGETHFLRGKVRAYRCVGGGRVRRWGAVFSPTRCVRLRSVCGCWVRALCCVLCVVLGRCAFACLTMASRGTAHTTQRHHPRQRGGGSSACSMPTLASVDYTTRRFWRIF